MPATTPLIAAMIGLRIETDTCRYRGTIRPCSRRPDSPRARRGSLQALALADALEQEHVRAGAEAAPGAGDDDRDDRAIRFRLRQRVLQLGAHAIGQALSCFGRFSVMIAAGSATS